MRGLWRSLLGSGLLLSAACASAQQMDELLAMSLEELTQVEVHLATGTPKKAALAPASTTLITDVELDAMGVQTLDQALEPVLGLHVSHGGLGYGSRYYIRGIATGLNPQTLVMVNGIPQTSLQYGDRVAGWSGVPIAFIKRIEIIRGPGSAVHGADAFAGVINIITKTPDDMKAQGQASVAYGSFNTGRASLLQGGHWGQAKTALALAYHTTQGEGFNTLIEEPTQLSSPGVTLTALPEPLRLGRQDADMRFDVVWGNYQLRLAWQESQDAELGRGIAVALDPEDSQHLRRGTFDLGWKADRGRNWQFESRLSYLYLHSQDQTPGHYFPAGTFGALDGVESLAELSEENARLTLTALYQGWLNHRLRLGSGLTWGDLYHTANRVNFTLDTSTGGLQPLPAFIELADSPTIFQPEAQRTHAFAFLQDEWRIADDWELTAGARFDHYSDFGDTLTPRLALVWQTTPNLTSKLLYGEAFRAPAFAELYARATPWEQGNPQLQPERLHSLEAAFSWQATSALRWEFNLYQFYINDLILLADISTTPSTFDAMAQNIGRLRGRGLETELRYQLTDNLHWLVNFSRQQTIDRDTGVDLGRAPMAQASSWLRWQFAPNWLVTPQLNWVGKMPRTANDSRPALNGYTTVNVALRKQWPADVEVALVGTNVLNADTLNPSRSSPSLEALGLSSDTPQGGRSLSLEMRMRW